MNKKRYAAAVVLTMALATAGALAYFGMGEPRKDEGGPYFYVTILKALYGNVDSGIYRFSFSDFSESGTGGFDDAFIRDRKFIDVGLDNEFTPRRVFDFEGTTLLAWGRNGAGPGAPARIFQITESGDKKLLMQSSENRFRDMATGTILWKKVFVAITHGNGYLFVRSVDTGEEHVFHTPYYGLQGNRSTLLHFVQLSDLDGDGNDEIYFSATTPYFGGGSSETYEEGTVYRATFPTDLGDIKLDDVGLERPAFVRRLGEFKDASGKPSLVSLYEGTLDASGKTIVPIRVVRQKYSEGKLQTKVALTLDGHKECKGIAFYKVANRPTFQIGCDNGMLYFVGEKPGSDDFEIVAKYDLSGGLSEEYLKKRSTFRSQDLTSIHTVSGKDVDGDGIDELLLGINNLGIVLLDPDTGKTKKIPYRFSHERVYERDEWFVIEDISPTIGKKFFTDGEFFNFKR